MYRLDSGIKVIPYRELKEKISPTLLNVFLESYSSEISLEEKLEDRF